ncbi:MAG: cytochrome c [Candidatus Eremiobacteraeota bacterium]|nr:cytochrome c [Candidatus Eremiobacteraeota bacterium]
MMKHFFPAVGVAALLGAALVPHVSAVGRVAPNVNAGAQIVADHGCMGCHGAKFEGGVGPKLFGIEHRKSAAEIFSAIAHPRAPMPDYGLSTAQIADVAAYLSSLDGGSRGELPVVTLAPAMPRDHAAITVRFPGAIPKTVFARASMNMGTMSHHVDAVLYPTSDRRVWNGTVHFSMGGAWVLTVHFDGKSIDLPLTVSGAM